MKRILFSPGVVSPLVGLFKHDSVSQISAARWAIRTIKLANMKKIILYAILIVFSGCQEDANTINGRTVDRYTNEPVEGLYLNFGVAKGSGFLSGTSEKNKYVATTDASGYFAFESSDDDRSGSFFISSYFQFIRELWEFARLHPW